MSASWIAGRIYEDTLNTVAQADEMEADLGLDEYVQLMMALSDEMRRRAGVAVDRMIKGEV
jgi:hypothetical protein